MTTQPDLSRAAWFKSSFSNGQGGNCVETCALIDDSRAVRHSKDPNGPTLVFTPAEWQAFIAGVKLGEFDLRKYWPGHRGFTAPTLQVPGRQDAPVYL